MRAIIKRSALPAGVGGLKSTPDERTAAAEGYRQRSRASAGKRASGPRCGKCGWEVDGPDGWW